MPPYCEKHKCWHGHSEKYNCICCEKCMDEKMDEKYANKQHKDKTVLYKKNKYKKCEKYIIKSINLEDFKKLPGYGDYANNLYDSYEEAFNKRESYISQAVKKGKEATYGIFKLIDIRAPKQKVETEEVNFK